ncbi:tetratricopeptide repeat protein [Streptococcus sp. DD12]|uniref:tetratricopeptide repeat protein n=1 Tax=Streptococcus sp. DD12 TaxID=1777880 RepID=UPI00079A53A7|nr:tetratricopeptide repeat protein [Streptococcus sp. DD12]KXT76448.1 TPR-repeat-containing protein [Streptococcus sp. DD12]
MSYSQEALEALEAQDMARFEQLFNQAQENDSAQTLLALADYLEAIGFYPQAKVLYEKLLPHYPDLAINLAQIAGEDGDIEQAFAYLEAIPQTSDAYLSALLTKADLYQLEGLTEVARDKMAEAQALSEDPIVTFGLAEMEFELGNFSQAIKAYAQLDQRSIFQATGVSTYQRIGFAYANLGKFEAAIEFLEKAVELDFEEQTLMALASLLYEAGESQKANLYFKQLDTLNPDFPGYEYLYAQSLHAEHETTKALQIVQQGLAKNSFDSQLLLLASQLAYELHDKKASEAYLRQALDISEDREAVVLPLSNLLLEAGRYDEIPQVVTDDTVSVLPRWNLAKAYRQLEEDAKAQSVYADIVDDLKTNPEFLLDYALYLRELGEKEKASHYLKAYLKEVPDDGQAVAWLADWQAEAPF